MQCIREKMDVIDIEDEAIDAEVLDSMAVSQVSHMSHIARLSLSSYVCLCVVCVAMPCRSVRTGASPPPHTHRTFPLLSVFLTPFSLLNEQTNRSTSSTPSG